MRPADQADNSIIRNDDLNAGIETVDTGDEALSPAESRWGGGFGRGWGGGGGKCDNNGCLSCAVLVYSNNF